MGVESQTTPEDELFEEIRFALLHPSLMRGDLVEKLDLSMAKIIRLRTALEKSENEARRYAKFYPDGSDSSNTFTLLANRIAEFANCN